MDGFLQNSKCFLYFLPFTGGLVLSTLLWAPPEGRCQGQRKAASPFPSLSYDPCRPFPQTPQSSLDYPFRKVCLFLRQILFATGRSGEERITSDGWSGELMKGRLQGFAGGASGCNVCGWFSTSGCSLLQKWPQFYVPVIVAGGIVGRVKNCCERCSLGWANAMEAFADLDRVFWRQESGFQTLFRVSIQTAKW